MKTLHLLKSAWFRCLPYGGTQMEHSTAMLFHYPREINGGDQRGTSKCTLKPVNPNCQGVKGDLGMYVVYFQYIICTWTYTLALHINLREPFYDMSKTCKT
jgi:hypothetical protein